MRARRRNASKRSVRRRVAKALKKYVRGNASIRRSKKHMKSLLRKHWPGLSKAARAREHEEITQILKSKKANPARVKGRKVKGGRAVTLRNFTGTIVKKSDGTVGILGRGRRK